MSRWYNLFVLGLVTLALPVAVMATTAHPGGGTPAANAAMDNAAQTAWSWGTKSVLPLAILGAVVGGGAGALGNRQGIEWGKVVGGLTIGIFIAFGPAIVVALATGAASGLSLNPVVESKNISVIASSIVSNVVLHYISFIFFLFLFMKKRS